MQCLPVPSLTPADPSPPQGPLPGLMAQMAAERASVDRRGPMGAKGLRGERSPWVTVASAQAHVHCVAGSCLALGIKYAGTGDLKVSGGLGFRV